MLLKSVESKDASVQTVNDPIIATVEAIEVLEKKLWDTCTESSDVDSEADNGLESVPVSVRSENSEDLERVSVRRVQSIPEVSFESLLDAQLADETIGPVLRWTEGGSRPDWDTISGKSPALKTNWSQWDMLSVQEGVLVKRWESQDGKEFKWLLVLPRSLRTQVLDMLHASKSAGHLGREKTLPKVRERYYWVGMTADVTAYLRQCVACAQKKGTSKKHRAPLQQCQVGAPLERIAIDVLGPLGEAS